MALVACGQGISVPPVQPQPAPSLPAFYTTTGTTEAVPFTSAVPLGTVSGQPILPLFELPAVETNLGPIEVVFWGTKSATTGIIGEITEAQVLGIEYGATPPGSVHAYFNSAGLPVLFQDDASGYVVAVSYTSATTLTVDLCDSSFNPIAQASAQTAPAQGGPAAAGGSCSVPYLQSSARRIMSTTVGGEATDITDSLTPLKILVTGGSYLLGLEASLIAILEFKEHMAVPSQAPIGTPITLVFLSVALLFLPYILNVTGTSAFGPGASTGPTPIAPVYLPPPS